MKAGVDGTVLAEASREELIRIEDPPQSVDGSLPVASATPYTCGWKGRCQYFSVRDGENILQDRAFSYPVPYPSSLERVGRDYSNYVAFWKEVRFIE